ncbi:MAG: phosphoglycerate kinase [Phycisphaerales bacterium]|nr:phosphoglycerate kinase [Phycisphaerales bacterium]
MAKKSIDDITVRGKRVLVRLDLNVPLNDRGRITDDRRIREALPTVRRLLKDGGRLILISHLGRPTGNAAEDAEFTLRPVALRLTESLNRDVVFVDATVGDEVRRAVDGLTDGSCCLLENLRFHPAETIADKKAAKDGALRKEKDAFAAGLADLADAYVNDAFGTCHRDNASMLTVPQRMAGRPRVVGYLVQKELRFLGDALRTPKRPFVAILGGAKVSDKVGAIEALLGKCDTILIGGAMAYTFAAATGHGVGDSLVEPDRYELARSLLERAGGKLRLPTDSVVAKEIVRGAATQVCTGDIPSGMKGLDIGPATIKDYAAVLHDAGTIVWNGPMGVFETPPFEVGTMAMARAVADATDRGAVSIVGGGDSASAVEVAGVAERVTHVSTGGGASLEFLEGKPFAAIDVLDDA